MSLMMQPAQERVLYGRSGEVHASMFRLGYREQTRSSYDKVRRKETALARSFGVCERCSKGKKRVSYLLFVISYLQNIFQTKVLDLLSAIWR